MSMTFLDLFVRAASECGETQTAPSTIANQVGRMGQIVKWIKDANREILTRHNNWLFMKRGFTVNTVASDGSYAYTDCTDTTSSSAISTFRDWDKDTFYIYLTSIGVNGQTPLVFMDYLSWYQHYNVGSQNDSYPVDFTIGNDKSIIIGPKPNAVYTITGEYYRGAVDLALDADAPLFPGDYHMAIVNRVMMKYGRYNGAQEVYQDGANEYARIMFEMERTQLPELMLGEPL